MAARLHSVGRRGPLRLLVSVLVLGTLMSGCSDSTPALTDEQFHAQAGEIYAEVFGKGVNTWPQMQDALEAHFLVLEKIDRPFRDDPDVSIDDWPTIQIDLVRFGTFPRPGVENALGALKQIAASGVLDDVDRALALSQATACGTRRSRCMTLPARAFK